MEVLFLILLLVCCGVDTEKERNRASIYYTDSTPDDIFQIPTSGGISQSINVSLKTQTKTAMGITYDPMHHCIYWTDTWNNEIGRYCLYSQLVDVMSIPGYMSKEITVDQVNNILYTSDYHKKVILTVDFANKKCSTTVSGDMGIPSGVVVDPHSGWLYWADERKHLIEKARTSGSDRRPLVSTGIHFPLGVAINKNNSRLYYCGWYSVQSINTDGSGRQRHFQDKSFKFASIAVDSQFLYLRTWKPWAGIWRLAINSVNATGQQLQLLTNTLADFGGIVLVESPIEHLKARTGVAGVNTTTRISRNPQEIYKYALLIAVPIVLLLVTAHFTYFCFKSGKFSKCIRNATDNQQDLDVHHYEEVQVNATQVQHHSPIDYSMPAFSPRNPQHENNSGYLVPVPTEHVVYLDLI